jgi:hypothetical protein
MHRSGAMIIERVCEKRNSEILSKNAKLWVPVIFRNKIRPFANPAIAIAPFQKIDLWEWFQCVTDDGQVCKIGGKRLSRVGSGTKSGWIRLSFGFRFGKLLQSLSNGCELCRHLVCFHLFRGCSIDFTHFLFTAFDDHPSLPASSDILGSSSWTLKGICLRFMIFDMLFMFSDFHIWYRVLSLQLSRSSIDPLTPCRIVVPYCLFVSAWGHSQCMELSVYFQTLEIPIHLPLPSPTFIRAPVPSFAVLFCQSPLWLIQIVMPR